MSTDESPGGQEQPPVCGFTVPHPVSVFAPIPVYVPPNEDLLHTPDWQYGHCLFTHIAKARAGGSAYPGTPKQFAIQP